MSVGVLFVCLGNICRSPLAQGLLECKAKQQGLEDALHVDSRGTAAFHVGKPPDPRSVAAADRAGFAIDHQFARQIGDQDYQQFRYLVAMDRVNLINIQSWAPGNFRGEIKLLMDYCPQSKSRQVDDPYYGDANQFDATIKIMEPAIAALLAHIKHEHCI